MYYSHYWWHVIVKDFLNLKILPACMSFILRIIMITKGDVRNILTFVWFICAHMIWFFWQSKKPAPRTTLGTGKSEDDSESSGDEDVEDDEEVYESIVSDSMPDYRCIYNGHITRTIIYDCISSNWLRYTLHSLSLNFSNFITQIITVLKLA